MGSRKVYYTPFVAIDKKVRVVAMALGHAVVATVSGCFTIGYQHAATTHHSAIQLGLYGSFKIDGLYYH